MEWRGSGNLFPRAGDWVGSADIFVGFQRPKPVPWPGSLCKSA